MISLLQRLSLMSLLLLAVFQAGAQQSNFKHITIDGSFADWAGIAPAMDTTDPQEKLDAIDYKEIYLAHDQNYLYVRFTLYTPGDPFTARNNIFIDSDSNSRTGFGRAGSELLIQSGVGYQERDGHFNEGGITGLDWQAASSADKLDFEFRISRSALYAGDSTPVFDSAYISLLLEAETATFTPVEFAPDFGTVAYDLSAVPPPFTGASTNLVALSGSIWSYTDAATAPATDWKLPGFDPTVHPFWGSGSAIFGYAPNPAIYPAPLATPLSKSTHSAYFLTRFDWNFDTKGIVLISTNLISDGAAIYLNGVEAKRLRLPAGALSYNSSATEASPTPGQPEVLVLPSSSLTIGENLLAVEVHQTEGDTSDLVFGLSLTATGSTPVLITNPSEPADREVIEGDTTEFIVEATGTEPITYQWFKGTEPIPGATGSRYSIAKVLEADAGSYHVELSNPLTVKLSSRTAKLTTKAFPARINNRNLPADLTLLEGRPATFTVDAAGSAPLTYQWYKNETAIAGATNATFTIESVIVADSAEYSVVVGNRLPATVTSRKAVLTVSNDKTGPSIVEASGNSSKVSITFDESLDVISATKSANYTLDQGLSVTSAEIAPGSDRTVVLTTSAQTLGTVYSLTVSGVKDLFGNPVAPNTTRAFRSTISIDGNFDDWAGVEALGTDVEDQPDAADWKEVYVFNDDDYLYFRIVLHSTATWPTSFSYINLFVDTDNNDKTGYQPFGAGTGSELLVQGGGGFQEKATLFNAGEVLNLDWKIAPEGTSSEFEFRISRQAINGADGSKVFRYGSINVSLESENTSYVTRDRLPDAGALHYVFQPEILDPVQFTFEAGQLQILWTGDGVLQSRESLTSGDWADEADQTNPQTVDPSNGTRYYRLFKP